MCYYVLSALFWFILSKVPWDLKGVDETKNLFEGRKQMIRIFVELNYCYKCRLCFIDNKILSASECL